jgi:hypothetical protein
MVRLGLPNSDTAVLLTPRWGELALPLQILLLAALVLVPVVLVLTLYRYELKLVSAGPPRSCLPAMIAILLAIFLVGFQPILGRDWTGSCLPAFSSPWTAPSAWTSPTRNGRWTTPSQALPLLPTSPTSARRLDQAVPGARRTAVGHA